MKEKTIILILLILLATTEAKGPEEVKAEWNQIICIVLRLIQFVAAGIAALVIILAGVKFMTSENLEERGGAKKMLIQAVSGLIIIIIAVQLVNYLVTGSEVERFSLSACDYAPTTTTTIAGTTTTTTPVATTTTTPGSSTTTTTTSSTTTSSTTTSTIPEPTTDHGICYNAEDNGLCASLNPPWFPAGYEEDCCTEWNCCCTPPSGACVSP